MTLSIFVSNPVLYVPEVAYGGNKGYVRRVLVINISCSALFSSVPFSETERTPLVLKILSREKDRLIFVNTDTLIVSYLRLLAFICFTSSCLCFSVIRALSSTSAEYTGD